MEGIGYIYGGFPIILEKGVDSAQFYQEAGVMAVRYYLRLGTRANGVRALLRAKKSQSGSVQKMNYIVVCRAVLSGRPFSL